MDEREKERQREEEKKKRVIVIGSMKSGNPFQLLLGEGKVPETAERVRAALVKGDVEIISPSKEGEGHVVIRWAELESCVVMTEWELERRALLQTMAQGGRVARG
jgi:hypothetical protein